MKLVESMKRHPYRTGAAAFVLGLVAAEGAGYALNPVHAIPENACVSPPAVSNTYIEPNTNLYLQTYTGLLTTGVVARGVVPLGAYGVRASFKGPEAGTNEWDKNASPMTKAHEGGYALKMAIGDGAVQFAVQVVAPEDSPLCNDVPDVTYQHYDRSGYTTAPGTLPWRNNPVSLVTNLYGAFSTQN